MIVSYISHSTMSNITRSTTSNKLPSPSSSAASAVRVMPPAIPNVIKGVVGAAAFLQACASQAAVIPTTAANDEAAINTAHAIIIKKDCTMFLRQAFGINPNGAAIVDQAFLPKYVKKYKSVKTIGQYNDMIRCLPHWGDDEYLAAAPEDNLEASRIYRFHRQHLQGYNYVNYFSIEESKYLDGSSKKILIHRNTGGIVVHMLAIFDVIHEAHCRVGYLAVDKTLVATKPVFYSPTYELCKIYCKNCYVCMEKQLTVLPKKRAKKLIISSEF
jgi:hypothetical protein